MQDIISKGSGGRCIFVDFVFRYKQVKRLRKQADTSLGSALQCQMKLDLTSSVKLVLDPVRLATLRASPAATDTEEYHKQQYSSYHSDNNPQPHVFQAWDEARRLLGAFCISKDTDTSIHKVGSHNLKKSRKVAHHSLTVIASPSQVSGQT